MAENADKLRAEAERCRKLAAFMQTERTRQMLLRMAEEFDVEAAKAEEAARRT
jgi:hypothetical protein